MLHDLPGTSLVGGVVIVAAGAAPFAAADLLVLENVCRGWRSGGSQVTEVQAGAIPMPTGPTPSPLDVLADPLAWHPTTDPAATYTRRARRVDIWRDGDQLVMDIHYRDTYFAADKLPMVIHEYSLRADAEYATLRLVAVATEAHALPWVDCNSVPSSTEAVVGARLGEVESTVNQRLRGVAGCTHLNDTLRELDAVPGLLALLESV
jgi:hypothetical protein